MLQPIKHTDMKKLHLLKTFIDIFWFFSIIAIVGITIVTPFMLFSSEPFDLPVKVNGERITVIDIPSKILVVFLSVASYFFVYGIHLLRKLLDLFSKRQIFEELSITLLNKIGKCFVLASFITSIPAFFYNVIFKNNISVDFGGGFESFFFTASLGLFFMVLSEVFRMGKTIKEENELTV